MPSSPYPATSNTGADLLSTAPGADSGQTAIAVRIVSQLGAGSGGGGGSLATAAKGTTAAGSPTSTATDANTQALHSYVVNLPTTQAVSGTFWQATQPVSIASMPSTPVTGTFFQATQPVSIAATINTNTGLTQPLTDTQLRATAVPVSAAALPLPSGASTETTLSALNTKVAAVAKGTQGSTGLAVQDLKDSGRSARTITLDSFAVAATAETLMTMSYSTDNGTLTTGTSYTVTAGKRLRIQVFSAGLHTIAGNTTAVNVIVRVRVNNAGAATLTSPVQLVVPIQGVAAANQAGMPVLLDFPDGWEFVAGAGIGVTVACAGFVATTAAPKVDITATAFEY